MQFLGGISYSLYLVHGLFIDWLEFETTKWFTMNYKTPFTHAAGYSFAIYTPILIVVSWGLWKLTDEPAKDLANEVDQASRLVRLPPKPV